MVPSAVAQHITVKYLTIEYVKPAEILTRLSASTVMKCSQGSRCMTGARHLQKAEQRLKTCKDYVFCRKSYGQWFLGLSSHPSHQFSDRTLNHQCSLLFEASQRLRKANLLFKRMRWISLSPLQQHVSTHHCCDNRNTGGNTLGGTATPCL